MTPPCADDHRRTGRDWTAEDLSRQEAGAMARLCHSCPMRDACHAQAVADLPETVGVWGGLLWRNGRAINLEPDAPRKRSVHAGVIWDESRSKWKAFGQTPRTDDSPRRHFHLGYFDDEKRAALIARAWRIRNGQAA